MQQLSISEKEAVRVINREDGHRSQWTRLVRNGDPYDEKAYDMRIAMQLTTVEETASMIVNETGKQVLQPNEESRQAAKDFVLAAQVQVALTEKGYDVDVIAEREKVHIALNRYTARLDSMQQKLEDLAMTVPGVKEATSRPGCVSFRHRSFPCPTWNLREKFSWWTMNMSSFIRCLNDCRPGALILLLCMMARRRWR